VTEAARAAKQPAVEARLRELGAALPQAQRKGWVRWWPFSRHAAL
jgi:hypothetical protein